MSNYTFDGSQLTSYKSELANLNTNVRDAFEELQKLNDYVNQCGWSGSAKDAMVAYLDLMRQYHVKFYEKKNPIETTTNAFNQLEEKMTTFYTDFPSYLELRKI